MFNYFKKIAITNRANDEILYEYVMDELENDFKVKGLWAKAYANSNGDDNKIEPLYMQLRVQAIKDIFTSIDITYDELSRKQLFEFIKNGFKNTNGNTIVDRKKNIVIKEKTKSQIDEEKAMKLLVSKGYKPEKYSNCWKIKEPLGGKAKIDTLQDFLEYAKSRENHN